MVSNDNSSNLNQGQYAKLNELRSTLDELLKQKRRKPIEARLLTARQSLQLKHQKIVAPKVVILLGVALISIFILLFHKEDRLKDTFELVQPDRISVLYLQLLVGMAPGDNTLRLALARQYAKIGETYEARQVLAPFMVGHDPGAIEGKLLSLELDLNAYFAKAASDPSKTNDLATLKNLIAGIADEPVPVGLLPAVIQRSLELGRPELAAKLYERWGSLDGEHYFDWIQEAGRWYVAAGMPMEAAEKYKLASAASNNITQVRKFTLLAIKAMQAADKTPLALVLAKDFLNRYPKDIVLLDEAVRLSLASNDQKQALEWGKVRLGLQPGNSDQISKQVDLALSAGDLESAWLLSGQLLQQRPDDIAVRERSAHIAEWSGKQSLALEQWAWLAKKDYTNKLALESALRIADGLKSGDTALAILAELAEKRAFNGAEYNYLVNASGNVGQPDKAVKVMQTYLNRYPADQQAWETLAKVQENTRQLNQALNTWNYIGGHFGQPLVAIVHQADLLRRTGKTVAAYSKLVLNQKRASASDTEFWSLYGDLSWEQKRTDNALLAYQTIWKANNSDALAAERLIQLFRDKGQGQDAINIAKDAHRHLMQPRWLLLAMDTALQFKLWGELRQLMQVADTNKKQFERLEMYWLLHAQLNIHNQRQKQALADYRHALAINPKSKIAEEGGLWTLIDLQNEDISRINNVSRRLSETR